MDPYQSRDDEGTQSPTQTLDRGWGSCRDFAVLFVEAARSLGFGARIVSGYLYQPDQSSVGSRGAGSTHAWAEVYVPGAGWITFDPTNRSVGGFNLIPVAVARDIRQAMPVARQFRRNGRRLSGHVGRGPRYIIAVRGARLLQRSKLTRLFFSGCSTTTVLRRSMRSSDALLSLSGLPI